MRISLVSGALAIAALLAVSATPGWAQGRVRGVVLDEKGGRVAGATVQLRAVDFDNQVTLTTNDRGEFDSKDLSSGVYQVTVTKDGMSMEAQRTRTTRSIKPEMKFALSTMAPPPTLEGLNLPPQNREPTAAMKAQMELTKNAAGALEAYKAGRYEEASTALAALVVKLPECADCYMMLGRSYLALEKPKEAEEAFKKSAEVYPTVEAWTQLTQLYSRQKRTDEALEASRKASDVARDLARQQAEQAAGTSNSKIEIIGPSVTGDTMYNEGVVLFEAGRYAEARDRLAAATKERDVLPVAHYLLGLSHTNLGEFPQARQAFQTYLKLAPSGKFATEAKTFMKELPAK